MPPCNEGAGRNSRSLRKRRGHPLPAILPRALSYELARVACSTSPMQPRAREVTISSRYFRRPRWVDRTGSAKHGGSRNDRSLKVLKSKPQMMRMQHALGLIFRKIFAGDALVALQFPCAVRSFSQPISKADLRMELTRSHRDARLFAGGHDLLHAELAVAQKSNEGDKHSNLRA